MAGPEYDFFATGPRSAPSAPAPGAGFGTTITPSTAAPAVPAAPAAAAAPVNQFGLPVDAASPVGPYAAPGYGSSDQGIAAGVGQPLPGAVVGQHSRRDADVADERPGTVLAAGIVALVIGGLLAVLAFLGLLAYFAAKSQMDSLLGTPGMTEADAAMADEFVGALLTAVLVGVVVLAVFAALYLVLGVGTVRGRRGFAWGLLVVAVLNVLYGLYQAATGGAADVAPGASLGAWVSLAVSFAIVGLLTLGSGGAWLRRSA